jgi:hypothetical protein
MGQMSTPVMSCSRSGVVAVLTVLVPLAGACGGRGGNGKYPGDEEQLERWQTEQEWVLVSKERCVTGPFAIEVPAREVEFGRRFVVEVFGERGLPMDTLMAYPDGSKGTGWGWTDQGLHDHSACQAREEEAAGAAAPGDAVDGGDAQGEPRDRRGRGKQGQGKSDRRGGEDGGAKHGVEVEAEATLPTLDPYEGALPGQRRLASAIGWFPRGRPHFHNLDDIGLQYYTSEGGGSFRFQFWFHRPVDMQGVVVRFRDQLMVPTGSIEPYRAGFAARVAEVERRMKTVTRVVVEESRDPSRGKVPPPPRKEVVPTNPGQNVQWLPGYWKYHEELEDFVWIAGTFVVRAPPAPPPAPAARATPVTPPPPANEPPPAAAATASTGVASTGVASTGVASTGVASTGVASTGVASTGAEAGVVATVEAPRPMDAQIPPRPEPRREAIPPPPSIAGALWIPGYWQLQGRSWLWVAGQWQVPRQRGARFRAPSVQVRGSIKVYLPGGWTLGR